MTPQKRENRPPHPAGDGSLTGKSDAAAQSVEADDTSAVGQSATVAITDNRTAALVYASKAIPVFGCCPGTKTPMWAGGFKSATTDRHELAWFWDQNPDANVAAALPVLDDGRALLVLDPDLYKRGTADVLHDLELINGALPNTATVITPHGGRHFWFTVPADRRYLDSAGRGIDVKSAGSGYAMLPPSRLDDCTEPYRWVEGSAEVAELPMPWVEALTRKPLSVKGFELGGEALAYAEAGDVEAFLSQFPDGPPDARMLAVMGSAESFKARIEAIGSHEAARNAVYRAIMSACEGSPGVRETLPLIAMAYLGTHVERRRRGLPTARPLERVEAEFERMVIGAIAKAGESSETPAVTR